MFLLGTCAAATCQAQKYTVTQLQTLPGGTYTSAARMNNAGEVVGSADDSNGDTVAVAWNDGAPTIVYSLPQQSLLGGSAEAIAINSQGVIVGNDFQYEGGVFEDGPNVSAAQLFDHGVGVGAINDANVMVGDMEEHPVIWDGVDISQRPSAGLPTIDNGAYSSPSGISNAGVIVGTEYDYLPDGLDTYPVAVRWKPDPVTHAPGASVKALVGLGGIGSGASAVNINGWVVGWATHANKLQRAVLWEGNAGPYDLGTLGGKQSSANGINAEGDVAGQAQTASGAWHAVLWTHLDFKAIDLNLQISPALAKQVTLTSAADTNDRCRVLVNGVDNKTGANASFVLSLSDQSHCDKP
jgi:probable HAF family extracellular repeat protein